MWLTRFCKATLKLVGLGALFVVIAAPTGGGGSGGGSSSCSGDINSACSQVISGGHLGAATVPNAALVTTPITACSGDINAGCTQVTSGAHLGAATVPNASLVTTPITACSGDINAGCTQVTSGAHLGAATVPNASLVTTPITACSGDINSGCTQVTSGAHLGATTVPISSLATDPTNASNLSSGTVAVARGGTGSGTGGAYINALGKAENTGTISGNVVNTLNKYDIWSVINVTAPITWSHVCVNIGTADGSNKYDIALYNSAGTFVADIGAQSLASTGYQCIGIIQNASCTGSGAPSPCCTGSGTGTCPVNVTSTQGPLYIVSTGNATTLKWFILNGNAFNLFASSFAVAATASGIAPSSITPPASSPVQTAYVPLMQLY